MEQKFVVIDTLCKVFDHNMKNVFLDTICTTDDCIEYFMSLEQVVAEDRYVY